MASAFYRMLSQGKITPPPWMASNLVIEVVMGSRAYGCETPGKSDYDLRGIFMPQKAACFPNTSGLIVGYHDIPKCDNFNAPGNNGQPIIDEDGRREYDFQLWSLTNFFKMVKNGKANQIDMLFVQHSLIKHCTVVGQAIFDNRNMFLSKRVWPEFRGYACAQFHKLRDKKAEGKRLELINKYGYDTKFAYHCLRLLNECEQILTEGNLDLTRGRAEYKAIRNGEWNWGKLEGEFNERKLSVEEAYRKSTLPEIPDETAVEGLLIECLQRHYGSLTNVVSQPDAAVRALRNIDAEIEKVRRML